VSTGVAGAVVTTSALTDPTLVIQYHKAGDMTRGENVVPGEALADVDYLSRSENRVVILDALADGPATRRALAERTDVSRATLDRIVNEFEERGWAERQADGEYAATAAGTHVVREFRPFVESVAAVNRLGDAVEWLPTEGLDIGLGAFSDATVRHPKNDDPAETVEFVTELIRDSAEFRSLTHLFPPGLFARVMREEVLAGDLTVEAVATGDVVDHICDSPDRRGRWRDVLAAGSDLYRCEPPIPCNLMVFDGTVLIKRSDAGPIDDAYGVPIVSESDAVAAWAHDLIDSYREETRRVDADVFAGPETAGADEGE
jgi:predicted transcriptional regulator